MAQYNSELDMFIQQYAERSRKLNKLMMKNTLKLEDKKN
jgi:hypothetical protein